MQTNCEICGTEGSLHVDHDHATGLIRGRLCGRCNRALGFVEQREWLAKALAYLSRTERFGDFSQYALEQQRLAGARFYAKMTPEKKAEQRAYTKAWFEANPDKVAVYRLRSNALRRKKRAIDPRYARGSKPLG